MRGAETRENPLHEVLLSPSPTLGGKGSADPPTHPAPLPLGEPILKKKKNGHGGALGLGVQVRSAGLRGGPHGVQAEGDGPQDGEVVRGQQRRGASRRTGFVSS